MAKISPIKKTSPNKANGQSNRIPLRKAKAATGSSKKMMPRGVDHPETGKKLSLSTQRCGCGGITGSAGSAKGAKKLQFHLCSHMHMKWDLVFPPQN